MAFSFFKRDKQEPEPDQPSTQPEPPQEKRGFLDRMKQAVTRTRETLSESIGSVIALTREIDTRSLTESQLSAATIESLAENTSDSIVAPLQKRFEFREPFRLRVRAAVAQCQRRERDDEQPREHSGKTDAAAFGGIQRAFLRAGVAAELQEDDGQSGQ